jgi:hypothetical protein
MRFLMGLLAILLCAAAVEAGEDRETLARQAAMNASEDFASCFAYFRIVAVGMANSGLPEDEAAFEQFSDMALLYGSQFAKLAGLLDEAFSASADMALQEQIDRIDGNTSNLAILNRDYMRMCESALQDPSSRLQYWADHLAEDIE